jgi:hypothetical protein
MIDDYISIFPFSMTKISTQMTQVERLDIYEKHYDVFLSSIDVVYQETFGMPAILQNKKTCLSKQQIRQSNLCIMTGREQEVFLGHSFHSLRFAIELLLSLKQTYYVVK